MFLPAASILGENFDNFFTTVVNFLSAIYDYVTNMVMNAKQVIMIVTTMHELPFVLFDSLWTPLAVCVFIVCGVAILKILIGWGNA